MAKLLYSSILGSVFCDYFAITFPSDCLDNIKADLSSVFDLCGLQPSEFSQDIYEVDNLPGKLILGIEPRSKLARLSVSGSICSHLRDHKVWDSLISVVNSYPHKVTLMDATADFYVSDIPAYLDSLKMRSRAGSVRLSRKNLPASSCKWFFSASHYTPDAETGTIYLGRTGSHDVTCKVYDKQQERFEKGFLDTPPIVRVEFRLTAKLSLRDVHSPSDIFYHYAQQSLVVPPPDYVAWQPYGSGFDVQRQPDLFTTAGKILNILKFSTLFGKVFRMASLEWGNDALPELQKLVTIAFHSKSNPSV